MKTNKTIILILLYGLLYTFPVCGNRVSLLEAWKESNKDYANDIQESTNIYKQLKEEQQAIAELKTVVERHLRTKNAELLADTITSDKNIDTTEKLRNVIKNIMKNYDNQLIENIFSEAINELILMNKLTQLPDILWRLYQDGDSKLFEFMLKTQIQIFNAMKGKYYTSKNEFLKNYVFKLYKIKREPLYSDVGVNLKSNVDNILNNLPQSFRYIFFAPYFCLKNVKYDTYFYTAIGKSNENERPIWLWGDTKTTDDTSYIKGDIIENISGSGEQPFKITLIGTKYHVYYYMKNNAKKSIVGWDSSDNPKNHTWNIEFVNDDSVVFTQNNFLMCAIELHDGSRRNVGGIEKGIVSINSSECQWSVVDCDHRK